MQTGSAEQAPSVRLRAVEVDPARLTETQHLCDLGVVDDAQTEGPCAPRATRPSVCGSQRERRGGGVGGEHRGPVGRRHRRHRDGDLVGDLRHLSRRRQRARQLEQLDEVSALLAHFVERGCGIERSGRVACVHGEHPALVGEEPVCLGIASGEPSVPAARRHDVHDEQLRIVVGRHPRGEQRHELRDLVVREADVMHAQGIDVGGTHREHELGRVRRDRGSLGDAGQDGVDVVVRDEVGRGRQHLVERRVEVGELCRQHRRLAATAALRGRLPDPGDLVDASTVAFGLASVLHDCRPGQTEERTDLRQQPDVVLTVGAMGLDGREDVVGDQRARPLDLERFHDRDARELPCHPRKVAQHHRRGPEAAEQRPGRRADAEGERCLTDVASDDGIVEHDRGRLEEGDLLRVGAPRALVADLSLGALLARELQQAPDSAVAGARPDVLHDEAHRGAGGLAFEIGRDVTHGSAARLG